MLYPPDRTCRTCLGGQDELTSLHTKDDSSGRTLLEKLRFCASMQFPATEYLPMKACSRCIRYINDYYYFKLLCERSEKTLEKLAPQKESAPAIEIEAPDVVEVKTENIDVMDVVKSEVDFSEYCGTSNDDSWTPEVEANNEKDARIMEIYLKDGCDDLLEPELEEISANSRDGSLPSKSRERYEKTYDMYCKWKISNKAKNTTENVILAYLTERNKIVNSATLWSEFSMLKSVIKLKEGIDIGLFNKTRAFLKKNSTNYQPKRTKTLDNSQCVRFLKEAPDEEFLMFKVALIMGIYGACRSIELLELTVDNVEVMTDCIIVTISSTKNNRRSFVLTKKVDGELEIMNIVLKYYNLRPPNTPHKRFFIKYKDGTCTRQPVGKNTLGKVPYNIAKFLQLPNPNLYTGHCFRNSSATLKANSRSTKTMPESHIEEALENAPTIFLTVPATVGTLTLQCLNPL